MSFIVEDGTGKPDATAYITAEFFAAYFTDRGNATAAAMDPALVETLVIQATDYIELRFAERFRGLKLLDTQALSFPRKEIPYAAMPPNLLKATAEYAFRAHTAPLAPDTAFDTSGRVLTKKVVRAGPIDSETTYASRGAVAEPLLFKPYPLPDGLLKVLTFTGGVYR